MIILYILIFILVLYIFYYNRFIRLDNLRKEAWSDINVQLKRRYSLIPNLVSVVKGYAKYETKTFEEIVKIRNSAIYANTLSQKEESENKINEQIKHIFVLAEKYPQLKANEEFLELQKNLSEIENTLQISRRYYNATVRDYNTAIHSIPGNLIAFLNHLKEVEYFEISSLESKNVKVTFHEK